MAGVGSLEMLLLYRLFLLFLCRGRGHFQRFSIRSKQKRRQALFAAVVFAATVTVNRSLWMRERSNEWWERIVLGSFGEDDWMANFRMN